MHAAPLRAAAALACFAAGLVLARSAHAVPSTLWFASACAWLALAAAARGLTCRLGMALATLCVGAGTFALRINEPPRDSLAAVLPRQPVLLRVRARLLADPQPRTDDRGSHRWTTTARVLDLHTPAGARPASGTLRVTFQSPPPPDLAAGDVATLTGWTSAIEPPDNPGLPDWRALAAQAGVAGRMTDARADPLPGPAAARPLLSRPARLLRSRALAALDSIDDPNARALLRALLLGQRDDEPLTDRFRRIGLAHVMAISGFHLAVLAGLCVLALRVVKDLGPFEPITAAAVIAGALLIIPPNAPVLRAGIMVLAVLAAQSTGRLHARLSLLAYAAVAVLAIRPLDLWSMGFQLSFGLVAALMLLGRPLHDRLFAPALRTDIPTPQRWWDLPRSWLCSLLSTTLLCWVVAAPLILYHTGQFSPLAIPATLVVLPVVTVLLAIGYAAVALAVVVPPAGAAAGALLEPVARATLWIVRTFDQIPWASLTLPRVSLAWTAVATAAGAFLLVRGRRSNPAHWATASIPLAWLAAEVWFGTRLPAHVLWRLDTLSVGDGTCHVLRSGSDALIWDCGSRSRRIDADFLRTTTRALGLWRAPTLVLSHPDADHYSGALHAADALAVRRVLVPPAFLRAADAPGPERDLLAAFAERSIQVAPVAEGHALALHRARLRFCSPPPDADWPQHNDHSLIALVEPARADAPALLLTGDAQDAAILRLLHRYPDLHADALELPHHGSFNASARRLVEHLQPLAVVQSTGPARLDDPRWAALRDACAWLTTADVGACRVEAHADGSLHARPLTRR